MFWRNMQVVTQNLDMGSGNLSKTIAEVCSDAVQESYVQKHRSIQEQFWWAHLDCYQSRILYIWL